MIKDLKLDGVVFVLNIKTGEIKEEVTVSISRLPHTEIFGRIKTVSSVFTFKGVNDTCSKANTSYKVMYFTEREALQASIALHLKRVDALVIQREKINQEIEELRAEVARIRAL